MTRGRNLPLIASNGVEANGDTLRQVQAMPFRPYTFAELYLARAPQVGAGAYY
jgi:hypothetical protein